MNASSELGVQGVVDVGAGDVGIEPHVSELEAVEGVTANRHENTRGTDRKLVRSKPEG